MTDNRIFHFPYLSILYGLRFRRHTPIVATRFMVPYTNTFLIQPSVVDSLVSPEGFQLTCLGSQYWCCWWRVLLTAVRDWQLLYVITCNRRLRISNILKDLRWLEMTWRSWNIFDGTNTITKKNTPPKKQGSFSWFDEDVLPNILYTRVPSHGLKKPRSSWGFWLLKVKGKCGPWWSRISMKNGWIPMQSRLGWCGCETWKTSVEVNGVTMFFFFFDMQFQIFLGGPAKTSKDTAKEMKMMKWPQPFLALRDLLMYDSIMWKKEEKSCENRTCELQFLNVLEQFFHAAFGNVGLFVSASRKTSWWSPSLAESRDCWMPETSEIIPSQDMFF